MEFTMKGMALLTSLCGILSFVCGVIAENKKPASGTVIQGKDVVICKYSSDPMLYLGYISFGFLLLCTIVGFKSISYPYRKKSIPYSALFGTKTMLTVGLAAALILWPTITEQVHHSKNVHTDMDYTCPTAKTGVIGGGAFVSLSSCLFWLVCLMLADNAREDYFDEACKNDDTPQIMIIDVDSSTPGLQL
ncbi:hypothetical protein V2J09_009072 [Rumex salicifolius]